MDTNILDTLPKRVRIGNDVLFLSMQVSVQNKLCFGYRDGFKPERNPYISVVVDNNVFITQHDKMNNIYTVRTPELAIATLLEFMDKVK